jgi:hypothetical protein
MEKFPAYVNILGVVLALWTIPWKVYAVWTAARNDQKKWFLALIILNIMSILEIYYIFKIAKKTWAEVKQDFKSAWHQILD